MATNRANHFEAILAVYVELSRDGSEVVATDDLIAEIDRRVAAGLMESPYVATLEDAYAMYKRRIISEFFAWLERKQRRLYVGVPAERTTRDRKGDDDAPAVFCPVDQAWGNRRVAAAVGLQYRNGLTMVERFGPYFRAFERTSEEIATDLDTAKAKILAGAPTESKTSSVGPRPERVGLASDPARWLRDRLDALYADALPHRATLRQFEPFFRFVEALNDDSERAAG